jgi:HEAT repeat protein
VLHFEKRHGRNNMRSLTLEKIRKYKARKNIRALIKALHYPKATLKAIAAEALGEIGDSRAIKPLLAALRDEDRGMREAVANSLEKLGWQPDKWSDGAAYWAAREEWDRCVEIGASAVEPLIISSRWKSSSSPRDWRVQDGARKALENISDPNAVKPLIVALRDEDWQVRRAAAIALGRIGESQAVEPLIDVLKDEDKHVREAAAEALGKLGDPRTVKPLIDALKISDTRQVALNQLVAKGNMAVEPLIAALVKGESDSHLSTIKILGEIGDVRSVEPLIADLRNEDRSVRKEAVLALGKIGDTRAVESIIAILDDEWNVRKAAIEVLGKLGDLRAIGPLIGALGNLEPLGEVAVEALVSFGEPAIEPLIEALKNEDSHVSENAAKVLEKLEGIPADEETTIWLFIAKHDWDKCVQIGVPAVEPLIAALKMNSFYVRKGAVESLVKIGDPRAVEPLIVALRDEDWLVRKAAAEALVRFSNPQAVEPLIACLGDDDYEVRKAATLALEEIGKPAVEPLINVLRDKDAKVRENVAQTLGKIGDSSAVPALIAALRDEDYHVRRAAAEALDKLAWKSRDKELLSWFYIAKRNWSKCTKIGASAVEPLILALRGKDVNDICGAAEALGKIGDPRAVEPLIKTLKDKNVNVRISAAKALVKLYQSAYLDDRQKKMILTLRADIAGTHKPHEDKYYEPCVGVPHKDVPAIKVEFPL